MSIPLTFHHLLQVAALEVPGRATAFLNPWRCTGRLNADAAASNRAEAPVIAVAPPTTEAGVAEDASALLASASSPSSSSSPMAEGSLLLSVAVESEPEMPLSDVASVLPVAVGAGVVLVVDREGLSVVVGLSLVAGLSVVDELSVVVAGLSDVVAGLSVAVESAAVLSAVVAGLSVVVGSAVVLSVVVAGLSVVVVGLSVVVGSEVGSLVVAPSEPESVPHPLPPPAQALRSNAPPQSYGRVSHAGRQRARKGGSRGRYGWVWGIWHVAP